jgi:alkane 1-monooxygenase
MSASVTTAAEPDAAAPGGWGYLLSLAPPAVIALCAVGGSDAAAMLPLLIAFAVIPLLSMIGVNWEEPAPLHPRTPLARLYYRAVPLAAVPAHLAALAFAAHCWSDPALPLVGRIVWPLSVGVFAALSAITTGHELIHHRGAPDRAFGGVLLSTACFGTFKIVHVRVHHRYVATPLDFSSAARGDSLYGFWLRCLAGNPREALRCERARLRGQRRPLWQSELVVWYGLSALWLGIAVAAWGWMGGAFFLLQSLIAILTLDWTNYVQHYGLRRRADAAGRFEPVRAHHAWSMQCRLSNLALLNLLRHGDHHANPLLPYHALAQAPAPAYPYPFGFMMLLALVPPLFRRVVHPLLDQLPTASGAPERAAATACAGRWTGLGYQLTFNSFIRLGTILRMAPHLREVSLRHAPRALLIGTLSLLALPLGLLERLVYGRRIAGTKVAAPPIFIVGHWRSGTTHLHNLFSQDASLGYLTMYQAIAPDCSLIGGTWLKRLLGRALPLHRPMDNMVWPIDSPQEEEVALGKVCAWSFYAQFMFPRRAREFFARNVLLENAPPRIGRELRASLRRVLQVATLHAGGRRLVLKNPVNTARVAMLLNMFPEAKFIHIHRSPYDVFASTGNLHRRITAFTTLQTLDMRDSAETVFTLYEGMMRRFLAERPLIPHGNFAEVRFADLERDPLGEMRRLYEALSLPGFAAAEPSLRRYVAGQTTYRKNAFVLSPDERARIAARWRFAFDSFAYEVEPAAATAAEPALAEA